MAEAVRPKKKKKAKKTQDYQRETVAGLGKELRDKAKDQAGAVAQVGASCSTKNVDDSELQEQLSSSGGKDDKEELPLDNESNLGESDLPNERTSDLGTVSENVHKTDDVVSKQQETSEKSFDDKHSKDFSEDLQTLGEVIDMQCNLDFSEEDILGQPGPVVDTGELHEYKPPESVHVRDTEDNNEQYEIPSESPQDVDQVHIEGAYEDNREPQGVSGDADTLEDSEIMGDTTETGLADSTGQTMLSEENNDVSEMNTNMVVGGIANITSQEEYGDVESWVTSDGNPVVTTEQEHGDITSGVTSFEEYSDLVSGVTSGDVTGVFTRDEEHGDITSGVTGPEVYGDATAGTTNQKEHGDVTTEVTSPKEYGVVMASATNQEEHSTTTEVTSSKEYGDVMASATNQEEHGATTEVTSSKEYGDVMASATNQEEHGTTTEVTSSKEYGDVMASATNQEEHGATTEVTSSKEYGDVMASATNQEEHGTTTEVTSSKEYGDVMASATNQEEHGATTEVTSSKEYGGVMASATNQEEHGTTTEVTSSKEYGDVMASATNQEEHGTTTEVTSSKEYGDVTSGVGSQEGQVSEQSYSGDGFHQMSQEKNLYGHIYNLFGKQQVSTGSRETVAAFSEDDLKSFYYNPTLTYIEDNVEDFIKETLEPRRESEFFELLNTYQNSSKNLHSIENDIEILRKKCKEQKKTVWSTEVQTVTVQGICKDQQRVSYTHSYETASFNVEQAAKIGRVLDNIKNTIHETFTLAKYSCQLARIHITSYMYELHAQSPVFCGISEQSPVIGTDLSQMSDVVFGEIQHLRNCLNALFIFLRKPTNDERFYNDITTWLETLVALLLRVASLPDHLFLLNHVLRCPPGVTRKMAHFIQPLLYLRSPADGENDEYLWHNPLLHHFVTMLATLLLPIKLREKYLAKMKSVLTPDSSDSQKAISWVIVDEDGEEDENPEESWMLIPENDLIALFLQFPFDGLYQQIFGTVYCVESEVVDSEAHGIGRKTGENVMQVFAFSTCLIQMLGKAFSLYNMTRYREFVKRLGRAIRTIVMHVSRYWALYKNNFLSRYGDNETTFHLAFGTEYSLEKLQLEYDQYFIRASRQIFSAHKLGAWQFLIDMPFESLSSKMMWTCYRFLHKGIMDKEDLGSLSDYISSNVEHQDTNDTEVLLECFKSMTEAEVVFLFTTFANMARARTRIDTDFITAVVREIFEISYLSTGLPSFLPKTGKDLLGSICSAHPFVMSLLLERIEETLDHVQEECVPLFQAFPVETWRPKLRDIQIIRNWLLRSPVESPEHQLSRYLLTNLNWQYQDADSDILYLPRCLHRAVAILLVETCALRLSNRPGGIAVDVFKETPGIIEQVTQLATSPYQRIIQHYSDQDLYKWLWEVMMFLHLHQAECPINVMSFTDDSHRSTQDITSSYDQNDFFKSLSQPDPLDLDNNEVLVNVLTSANNDGPLACYAALGLSNYGHDPEHLGSKGLLYLSVILEEGHTFAVCRIIANILPAFFTKDLLGLAENTRFTKVIDTVIHSDACWRSQDVFEVLSGIIQKHVQKSGILPGTDRALLAIEFWLRTLCSLSGWSSDVKIIQLLNNLLKFVFRNLEAHEIVVQYFVTKHKDSLKSLKEQGFLSSLLSFVVSHPAHSNIVDIKVLSSHSYFCYYILCSESFYQEESGLKHALANKLHEKPGMCVETALKKVTSSKDIIPIPSSNIDVYRWADLALSMDRDHPILAAVWQEFFYQFLRRVPSGPGIPEQGSVGLRFFESTVNTTYLKKLKARLIATVEYHKAESTSRSEANEDEAIYKTSAELHHKLAKLFQTLALWLDEPRLHDPTLYLYGLPPVYDAQRLIDILKSDKNIWLDCCDIGMMEWELNESIKCCIKFINERQKKISVIQSRQLMTKIDRRSNQIKTLDDATAPPSFKPLSTPLPDFPVSVLLDKQKIMETLGRYLHVLTEHARKFSMKFSSHSALDFEYLDMLQEFYQNKEVQLRMPIPCQRKKVCRGAADIVLKFHEKRSIDLVLQRGNQNREQYESLLHEMLHEMPSDICVNALCVEKSLTLLLKQWKSCQNPALIRKFEDIGSSVFFMFVEMVSDGVRRFPPTMQFFSTCVELLGKAFIMENRQQTETLLRTILAHPKIVGLLLPIFQPSTTEDNFTEMYENIIQTPLDVEVKFSLLSKFDFKSWLSGKPTLSERITTMSVLFTALCDCGFDPPVQITMLSEIYLRKMIVLLRYQFPDLFGETLRLLIDGSADHALGVNCWNEFLIATKILNKNMERRELELNTTSPFLLQQEQVAGTMTWLVTYYNDQRLSCNRTGTERLFTMWKPYLTPLTGLYEYIARQTIAASEQELTRNDTQVTTFLWKRISDFFAPWLFPCNTTSGVVYPWTETEVVQASEFVELYTRILIYFQNFLPVTEFSLGKPNVLSLLWELYSAMVTAGTVPSFILRVYHAKLPTLPWDIFQPTVDYLETMAQICSNNGNCRSFFGCIFPRIPWTNVMEQLRGDAFSLRQFQMTFFHLLMVLGNEKSVIKSEGSEMVSLLKSAEDFHWDLLEASMYSSACTWLVTNCDFTEILEPSSTIWSNLRLLKAAALLSDPIHTNLAYIGLQEKRQHYLKCMVELLCKCSSSPQHLPERFRPVIEQLMDCVLVARNQGEMMNIQDITTYYTENINLLNKISPREKLLGVALETIQEKIRDLTDGEMLLAMIMAACRSLASITLMVQVVEVAIETYFNNTPPTTDVATSNEGSTWNEVLATVTVPELSQREFVQECINHDSVLTLFTHVVQTLSQSQSVAHELNILKDVTNWTASLKPCNPDTETKIILLWYKILQLLVRQVNYGINLKELGQLVDFLVPIIAQAGEDRDTSGLLGVIGLGRKSPLTVNFRLLCRALSTFLSAQLPSNGLPRIKPNAPGTVKESKKGLSAGVPMNSSQRTNLVFNNLEGLRVNKAYSGLTKQVEFSCQFIVNPTHTLCDGPEFLGTLTKELFKGKKYLDMMEE